MDKLQRLIKGKIPGEATGIDVRKSVCTICDPTTQCGLDCYVKDGRIIKVEGSLENPHSGGTLCSKGAAQRQWVYHEDRLRTPLKRVGPRGSGEMVPISWTEALDTVTENLQRLKAESGPESVIFYCGYPKQLRPFLQRLAFQYGSPNYCTESSTCFTGMAMGWRLDYGQLAGPDMAHTKCLLVWTGNPFHANTPSATKLMDARERGLKFIVVDPRNSPIAAIADIHLKLRPGTDGALALAMANVIISEGLYDREFVSEWTRGFDEYRAYAADIHSGAGRGDHRGAGGADPGGRPALRHHQAGRHDAERSARGAPHQRGAEPAGRGRPGRAHGELRYPRRQRGPAVQLARDRRRRFHHPRAPVQDAAQVERHASPSWGGPLPRVDRDDRPGPGHGHPPADQHRRSLPAPRSGGVRRELPHVPRLDGLAGGGPEAGIHLRGRPVRHRHHQVRRHRPARLRVGGAERGALLSAEVRRSPPSR